ncbi:hypothetical protein [Corynebacterium silvaticum]|uniref:hypothetical protein n=1 Tax=Corynebacterium silvaticum TaxID=2320431 RepID=UPI001CECAF01|nr:hypothetical protein [Corynebacterium silvaticum]
MFLAVFSAALTWAGTVPLFPDANLAPIMLASLVWAVQIILIHGIQIVAATLKQGVGAPLGAGFAAYLLIMVSAIFTQQGNETPLGLTSLINNLAQNTLQIPWAWPLTSSTVLIIALLAASTQIFNRVELN